MASFWPWKIYVYLIPPSANPSGINSNVNSLFIYIRFAACENTHVNLCDLINSNPLYTKRGINEAQLLDTIM